MGDLSKLTPLAYDYGKCVGCKRECDHSDQWGNYWCQPCWARKLNGDDPRESEDSDD
jgi:hypothetical protein